MRLTSPTYLSDFRLLDARHRTSQEDAVGWLAKAHTLSGAPAGASLERMTELFERFGAGPAQIATRRLEPGDFSHQRWAEMTLFKMNEGRQGVPGTEARTHAYSVAANDALERLYADDDSAPTDLIHVTCTGYAAPSAAQKLVALRGWAGTTVTHAYHMGCYAALPAIRMASSFLAAGRARADIVHTELCSLHADPTLNDPEQLVIESLFGDGFARYTVGGWPGRGFRVVAVLEEVLPASAEAMRWYCGDRGMRMVLSREVPRLISAQLRGFVTRLATEAGLDGLPDYYAVHPGGPRVIDHVQRTLEIPEDRLRWSREVLRTRGNMSSATLPHIWSAMADDRAIPSDASILSLAFGPGLTLCGAVMTKCAGGHA